MRKGQKNTEETKRKISLAKMGKKRPDMLGSKNWQWKGDKVGYRGLHLWVQFVLGKPETCESCGKKGTAQQMHWANISGDYLRKVEDWVRLCAKCHKEFDSNRIQ